MSHRCSFSCGKSLDITQAEKLHKRLLSTIEKCCDIEFSADQVERVDTSGLQLLVAFCNAIHEKNLNVNWKQPSEILLSSAKRLGLTTALNLIPRV